MPYLALARKYRPTSFAGLVGQDHVVQTLSQAISTQRVHHAFVFVGPQGVGKTTTTRLLARALNCELGPTPTPCGSCKLCEGIAAGNCPDVLEIDGASHTGVDAVRALRERAQYVPSLGRDKIYIIDEVHMLSPAAFNALLKILEEPPPHVRFFFATTEAHKIPVTILSRCQRFDLHRVSPQVLEDLIDDIVEKEGQTLDAKLKAALCRQARGSVRDALSLLDQILSVAGGDQEADNRVAWELLGGPSEERIGALAAAILRKDIHAALKQIEILDQCGQDLGHACQMLVCHIRDLLVLKVTHLSGASSDFVDVQGRALEDLRAQIQEISRADLQLLFRSMLETHEDLRRGDLLKVRFEMGVLRALDIAPVCDLETLARKLEGFGQVEHTQARPQVQAPKSVYPEMQSTSAAPRSAPTRSAPTRSAPMRSAPTGSSAPAAPKKEPIQAAASTQTPKETQPTAAFVPTQQEKPHLPKEEAWDIDAVWEKWSQLVARLEQHQPLLASVLQQARVLSLSPSRLELGFERGSYPLETMEKTTSRQILLAALGGLFKISDSFSVILKEFDAAELASTGRSLLNAKDEAQERAQADIERKARAHPGVRQAVDTLGGNISKVRSLNPLEDESA